MFPLETCKYNIQPNHMCNEYFREQFRKFVNLVLKYITKLKLKTVF